MNTNFKKQHISKQFDDELQNVLGEVLAMGGLAEEQLINALDSLLEGDISLATGVIDTEIKGNTYEVQIDQSCTRILARRQPAATDLRLIMAITKTITDLERIGDEAQKIAKRGLDLTEKHSGPKAYYISIKAMGTLVTHMLHDGKAAITAKGILALKRNDKVQVLVQHPGKWMGRVETNGAEHG